MSRRATSHVCRLKFKNPAVVDLYYSQLVFHKVAVRSFEELRTVTDRQGVVVEHHTFHDAARARNLISGQGEYFVGMEEAAVFQMPHNLRGRLVTLILDGGPAPRLWADQEDSLVEGSLFKLDRDAAIDEALCMIDLNLHMHGKNNTQVNFPELVIGRVSINGVESSSCERWFPRTYLELLSLHPKYPTASQKVSKPNRK